MKGKLFFAAGAATGYVLGARAGRERYEQIRRIARGVRTNPKVQQATANLEHRADEMADQVKRAATHKANEVAQSVTGRIADTVSSVTGRGSSTLAYDPPSPPGSNGMHR